MLSEPGHPLASVISGMPEVWQRLLDDHVPDGSGRCAACRTQSNVGATWPCTLHVIAADARDISLAARCVATH